MTVSVSCGAKVLQHMKQKRCKSPCKSKLAWSLNMNGAKAAGAGTYSRLKVGHQPLHRWSLIPHVQHSTPSYGWAFFHASST